MLKCLKLSNAFEYYMDEHDGLISATRVKLMVYFYTDTVGILNVCQM